MEHVRINLRENSFYNLRNTSNVVSCRERQMIRIRSHNFSNYLRLFKKQACLRISSFVLHRQNKRAVKEQGRHKRGALEGSQTRAQRTLTTRYVQLETGQWGG